MSPTVTVVVPCYNEEEVLPVTSKCLALKMDTLIQTGVIAADSRVLFVDDGSKDQTWALICGLHSEDKLFSGLKLSRNRGHQNALLAGLLEAGKFSDAVISMDADLQDDINAMDEMIRKFSEGCDIVYGVRNSRKKDSFFKRFTAEAFYRFMNRMGAQTVFNHADYRLMSRRAVAALAQYEEVNLFLRGIVPLIGYRTDTVLYERGSRAAGESKYPLKKMLHFSIEGITSCSIKPIHFISILGFVILLLSGIALLYILISHLTGHTTVGWSSTTASVWFIGGLTMCSLGVIGEYVGKIYMESKHRPRFFIQERTDDTEKKV